MNVVIIGNGGHSKVVKDIIASNKKYTIVGYLDDKYEMGVYVENSYYGPISFIYEIMQQLNEVKLIIAIGDNKVRKEIWERLNLSNDCYETFVHDTAVVSTSAKIGKGTVVMPNVVINAAAQIGNHSILNTGAIVEHDNRVEDFTHVSPHVTLTGSVTIEEGGHVGASATIIPHVHVEEWSVVGAGAVVTKNVPAYCTVIGVPAKMLEKSVVRSDIYGDDKA